VPTAQEKLYTINGDRFIRSGSVNTGGRLTRKKNAMTLQMKAYDLPSIRQRKGEWMGHPKFHPSVGRLRRWTTDKGWQDHVGTSGWRRATVAFAGISTRTGRILPVTTKIPASGVIQITHFRTFSASGAVLLCISKKEGYLWVISIWHETPKSTAKCKKNVDPLLHPLYIQECHP
jgi:hypothetical protein